jgi:murein DD-endopeptidase MepM/ murein hydrolase activator NlpD
VQPRGSSSANLRRSAPGTVARATGALVLCAAAAFVGSSVTANADTKASPSTGGLVFVATPTISKLACVSRCASQKRVQGGSTVRIVGHALAGVREAIFHGTVGAQDDVSAKVLARGSRRARVRVPGEAVTGPVTVRTDSSVESPPTPAIDILPPLPPEILTRKSHVFPVRGRHDYGGAGARFGTGRAGHSHQGHDVFAKCGTPLVAARGGKVQFRGYHGAAGHYIVIDGAGTGTDYAYMHLTHRSPFRAGDRVQTGQRIGSVGDSGNAHGCHLHFELWSAPGWYQGGRPIAPFRALRAWDRWS